MTVCVQGEFFVCEELFAQGKVNNYVSWFFFRFQGTVLYTIPVLVPVAQMIEHSGWMRKLWVEGYVWDISCPQNIRFKKTSIS